MPLETKQCRGCKQVKDVCQFNRNRSAADGLQSYCKGCQSLESKRRTERARLARAQPQLPLAGDAPAGALRPTPDPCKVTMASPGGCRWVYDPWESAYESACGYTHTFSAGGLWENRFTYCPCCGNSIDAVFDAGEAPAAGVQG